MAEQFGPGDAFEHNTQYVTHKLAQVLHKLARTQRDVAGRVLAGTLDFEDVSPGVSALLITRILHPDLAEFLDRPEEFSGPGLPEAGLDTPNLALHALTLENAQRNENAARALRHLLLAAEQYHDEPADALRVAVHVLTMIHLQQFWGASVAAHGETEARKKQGEAALGEGALVKCCGNYRPALAFLRSACQPVDVSAAFG